MFVPQFSIIIPTFNSAKDIENCLNSILRQTFQNFEIIIQDNISTDNTVEIIKKISGTDDRIKLLIETDKGIYDAMNKGINLANGEWLYFLGSDDELYDNAVLQSIFIDSDVKQHSVLYGDVQIVGDTSWAKDGEQYGGIFDVKKLLKKNICHQSIFYRRAFIKNDIGYYNIDYKLCADLDFNLRCRAKTDFLYLDKIIARFTGGGASTRDYEDKNFSRDFLQNVLSYFNVDVFDPLVNDTEFSQYHKVLSLQKKHNYLKYLVGKVKKKLI